MITTSSLKMIYVHVRKQYGNPGLKMENLFSETPIVSLQEQEKWVTAWLQMDVLKLILCGRLKLGASCLKIGSLHVTSSHEQTRQKHCTVYLSPVPESSGMPVTGSPSMHSDE